MKKLILVLLPLLLCGSCISDSGYAEISKLSPVGQVAAIVCASLVGVVIFLAITTDFFDKK